MVCRFSTNLNTSEYFYTDSNGLVSYCIGTFYKQSVYQEMQQRKINYRSWHFNQTEEVAGNYFPIISTAFIQDTNQDLQLT